jgi:chromosome segregation ATPase
MNTILDNDEDLRRQFTDQTAQVAMIKKEKDRILNHIQFRTSYVDSLRAEMEKQKQNPTSHHPGMGAPTVENMMREIQTIEAELSRLEASLDDLDQPLDDAEETRNQTLFIIADKIGLDNLRNERRTIGKQMAKHNRLQHEAYELQKERYENCKKTFGFTPDDRAFIDYHKNINKTHMDEWLKLSHEREEICELIDILDPNDQDAGFDEMEDA